MNPSVTAHRWRTKRTKAGRITDEPFDGGHGVALAAVAADDDHFIRRHRQVRSGHQHHRIELDLRRRRCNCRANFGQLKKTDSLENRH